MDTFIIGNVFHGLWSHTISVHNHVVEVLTSVPNNGNYSGEFELAIFLSVHEKEILGTICALMIMKVCIFVSNNKIRLTESRKLAPYVLP